MIGLTQSQSEILQEFFKYDIETKGDVGRGLTSASLGKRGVNRRTFEINQNFLLNHYLIKTSFEEKHGHQTWKYFDITAFGAMTLILWNKRKDQKEKIELSNRFFPDIVRYRKKLEKLYGKLFEQILLNTIESFEISPDVIIIDKSGKEVTHTSATSELMKFNFGRTEFVSERHYDLRGKLMIDVMDENDHVLKTDDWNEGQKSPDEIIDRFTFKFFYNLISFPHYLGIPHHSRKIPFEELKNIKGSIKNKSIPPSIFQLAGGQLGDLLDNYDEMIKIGSKSLPQVLEIIKKDSRLNDLFTTILTEIKSELKVLKHFNDLEKKLQI